MSGLLLQILLLVFLIMIVIYISTKELKKRIRKLNKDKLSNDLNNSDQIVPIEVSKVSNGLDKLILNLEEMIDRKEDTNVNENRENLNFFSTVINNDTSFVQNSKDTFLLEKKELKEISKHLDLKLGTELSSMVQRIDKDGNIILGMEALKFITGEHIPLITPNGSIRVLNLLTIEDEIILSLEAGKPIFLMNNKNKTIRRLEKEEVDILVKNTDELEKKINLEDSKNELKNLAERNSYLENTIDELKNQILKLEAKNEVYQQLTKNKEISNKETFKSIENINLSSEINDNVQAANKDKKINSNITNIGDENIIETKIKADIEKEKTPTKKIDVINEVKIEYTNNDAQIKDDNKTLTKKIAEKFINNFFLEKLLRKNGGDNREVIAENLIFITYEQEIFTKTYYLKFLYKNTINEMKKFLLENGYKDNDANINQMLNLPNIEVKEDVYFLSSRDKQLYKSKIIKVKFTQDDISPFALINEKQNGYLGGFTKDENEKLISTVLDKKIYSIYQRNLKNIADNNFITLG